MLDYTLVENPLTDTPNALRAQVINVISYSQADIVEHIMKIGAGLTRSDVESVIEALKQTLCTMVANGNAFTSELFNAYPSVAGVFDSNADSYDHNRHKVRINLQPGVALREAAGRVRPRKVAAGTRGLMIVQVADITTGSLNHRLTPNRNLRITGRHLKIMGNHPDVGIYFIASDGHRLKLDAAYIINNTHSELMIILPALPVDTYKLQIATQYSGGGRLLMAACSVTFDKLLTVE